MNVLSEGSASLSPSPTVQRTATLRSTPTPAPTQTRQPTPTSQPTVFPTLRPTPVPKTRPTSAPSPTRVRASPNLPTGALTSYQGAKRVGKYATVCGIVVSPNYLPGGPTFLNLDVPYPNQHFTILIWPEDRARYSSPPEKAFAGRLACAAGLISTYNGVAQIEARETVAWLP